MLEFRLSNAWLAAALLAAALGIAAPAAAAPVPAALAQLSCTSCPAAADVRPRFSDKEWKELADGEALVKEHSPDGSDSKEQREAEAFGVIPWPPSAVWAVLVDFESRPKYMANSTESNIVAVEGNRVTVQQRLSILWEDIRFSVFNIVDAARGSITWTMDESAPHDIAGTTGAWQVVPLDQGRHTLLMYRSHTDTGRPVPAIIENYLLKRSLPKMIDAVRQETTRRGRGSAYLLPGDSSE